MLVDLRSDTVTRPTPGMRAAMADADVGDDVYAEDPTIRRLEKTVAELFGHEAAVFAPTGTMANQIALRLVCPPATELLCDADAHIVTYEGAGAAHGGIQTRTIPSTRGLLDPSPSPSSCGSRATTLWLRKRSPWRTPTTVAAEPSIRLLGCGRCARSPTTTTSRCTATGLASGRTRGDGNPCRTATSRRCRSACRRSGGAPVGSLVVCSAEHGSEARVLRAARRWLAAGGHPAAAGLYALEHHVQRRRRPPACCSCAALDIDPSTVDTNIVLVDVDDSRRVAAQCRADGVLVTFTPKQLRLVTHLDVDDAAIDYAVKVVAKSLH